jgi:hypothetical protein
MKKLILSTLLAVSAIGSLNAAAPQAVQTPVTLASLAQGAKNKAKAVWNGYQAFDQKSAQVYRGMIDGVTPACTQGLLNKIAQQEKLMMGVRAYLLYSLARKTGALNYGAYALDHGFNITAAAIEKCGGVVGAVTSLVTGTASLVGQVAYWFFAGEPLCGNHLKSPRK